MKSQDEVEGKLNDGCNTLDSFPNCGSLTIDYTKC